MKKSMTICLVLALLLYFGAWLHTHNDVKEQRIQLSELSTRMDEIEKRQTDTENLLPKLENQYIQLSGEIATLDSRVSDMALEMETLHEMHTASESTATEAPDEHKEKAHQKLDAEPEPKQTAHEDFYGRLYIPAVNIDVALYNSKKQSVTDRADSANIFTHGSYSGQTIADHNNQEFSKLFGVEVGMTGYIQLADGTIINIKCVDVFDGYNVEKDITDKDGVSAMGRANYMMYTCRNGWQNVLICLWNKC